MTEQRCETPLVRILFSFLLVTIVSCSDINGQKIVSVNVSGVVSRPGPYKVASNATFTDILRISGGPILGIHTQMPRRIAQFAIERDLRDGSILSYVWAKDPGLRKGQWRYFESKDRIWFAPSREVISP